MKKEVEGRAAEQQKLLKQAQKNFGAFLRSPDGAHVIDMLTVACRVYPVKADNSLDTYFNLGMVEILNTIQQMENVHE
jgi:hypothetical protein